MPESKKVLRGRLTRCDLSQTQHFFAPWQADPWGMMRPPFEPTLARLSCELSGNIYDLDIERWLSTGWGDCTLQVENHLLSGVGGWRHAGLQPGRALQSQLTLLRARVMISPLPNPVGDVLRAVRQIKATDTGKALVMARKADENRYIIAICFMGTSRKFYDWLTNFKLTHEQGLHAGFLNVARQFEGNGERIAFAEIAQELGLESLTLEDILAEAQRQDSRFLLWVTGHSQGAAVSQAYVHLLVHNRGVLPKNVVCYTFAAPTVAGPDWQGIPAAYPIYNLLNADDYVPRVGASMRLGVDLIYYPDNAFRKKHYGYLAGDAAQMTAHERILRMLQPVQDTATMLEMVMGACVALRQWEDVELARALLSSLHGALRHLPAAASSLGLRLEDINALLIDKLTAAYRAVSGRNPDPVRVQLRSDALTQVIAELGMRAFTASFGAVLNTPHVISSHYDHTGALGAPYSAIVCKHAGELVWAIWHAEGTPRQLTAEGEPLLPTPALPPPQ